MKPRQRIFVAFVCGLVFALGLGVSGMTLPSKGLGFLDVTGPWDPSLACVMGGAVLLGLVATPWVLRRGAPLFDTEFHLPRWTRVDGRLVAGSVIFGLGWGLGGYCPGPAVVSLATGSLSTGAFVLAMTFGMLAVDLAALPRRYPAGVLQGTAPEGATDLQSSVECSLRG